MSVGSRISQILEAINPFHHEVTGTSLSEDIGLGLAAYPYSIDPDDHLYRRLSQATRELPPVMLERARHLSWTLYESNPLAHGIIETIKDYVVSKGFSATSADEDVQRIITKHWSDDTNRWDLRQHDRVRDLSIYGELLLVAFVNKVDGNVRWASVDPQLIRQVYTDPENPEVVHTVVVNPRRNSSANLTDHDKYYRVIHRDEDPASSTYNFMIGAKDTDRFRPPGSQKTYRYAGSVFYFTINSVTGAVRGRPDLMPVIDWLDAYDQILFNFVDRTLLMNCFVWDVTIKNATESQIQAWKARHSAVPKPGTVNVHNEGEDWQEVSPKFQRADFEIQQKTLKGQILSFMGLPPHWFGGDPPTGRGSNTSGGESTAIVRLSSRQLYIVFIMRQVIQFVLDQAMIAGELKRPEGKDAHHVFSIIAPEMSTKDLTSSATSLVNVVQALVIGVNAEIVDLIEAQKIFAQMAGELGAHINVESMIQRMKDAGLLDDAGYAPVVDQMVDPNNPAGGSQPLNPLKPVPTASPRTSNPPPKTPVSINSRRSSSTSREIHESLMSDEELDNLEDLRQSEIKRLKEMDDEEYDEDPDGYGIYVTGEVAGGS